MVAITAILAVALTLLVVALRRPWLGLILLLGALPLNGLITHVIPRALGLDATATTLAGAWHDALVAGIVLAAVAAMIRMRWRPGVPVLIAVAVVALGGVYAVVSPVPLTALYVFRVLYEGPMLLAALIILAGSTGAPAWSVSGATTAFVATASVGAAFTWLQVYALGFPYIQRYFTDPGGQIHHSYLATGLSQPRGIGLVNSPNELGAVLAVAILLALTPGLAVRSGARWWIAAILGLSLVLSYSRSGLLAVGVGIAVLAWLGRERLVDSIRRLRIRPLVVTALAPILLLLVVTGVVLSTSGGSKLVEATAQGTEPSAAGRAASVRTGFTVIVDNPLGLGLGTAGPKAARFDENATRPRILTETWYLLYGIQVGIPGLLLLGAAALVFLIGLWRRRYAPVAQAALAVGLGLGAGALFIPIIEEPTVLIALWALVGLGLGLPLGRLVTQVDRADDDEATLNAVAVVAT